MFNFKFEIGDLVYANDVYRAHFGRILKRYDKEKNHANFYSIDLIFKTQKTFYAKRWDDETFWETDIELVDRYDASFIYLKSGKIIEIPVEKELPIISFLGRTIPRNYDNQQKLEQWSKYQLFNRNYDHLNEWIKDKLLQYCLRSLSRGTIPNKELVVEVLEGRRSIPECGYLNCDIPGEHIH